MADLQTKEQTPNTGNTNHSLSDDVFAYDHGYSTMKAIGAEVIPMFPTYVLPAVHTFGVPTDPMNGIIYKDDSGEFIVGNGAMNIMEANPDKYKPEEKMDRYYFRNNKYMIAVRTAMALAYPDKTHFKIPLVVTGLPSEYVETDAPELESLLQKTHKFQLTFGGLTKSYEITCVTAMVLPQPYGTLCAFAYNNKGELIRPKILHAYTRIDDWGFKTTDPQLTKDGVTVPNKCFTLTEAFETTSQVYEEIRKHIRKETGKDVPVFKIRELIEQGSYTTRTETLEKKVINLKEVAEPLFRQAVRNVVSQVIKNDGNIEVGFNILTGGGAGNEYILNEYLTIYDDLFYPQMEGVGIDPAMANAFGFKWFGVNAISSIAV